MSDLAFAVVLEALESLLQGEPEPEAIEAWQRRFDEALRHVERGPAWPDLVAKAHQLATQLHQRADHLSEELAGLRLDMERQAQGSRALKAYKPS